jgi:hypothetical protein
MAYSFGGGVRPELGKTDYSGYLQGALTGAQGVAAGGSAIGQGIANLGATIGGAIKEYNAKKEQKALDEAAGSAVINYARENRAAAEQLGFNLDQQDKGQVNAIVKSLGGAAPTLKAIQGLSDSQKQDKMVQEQQNIQKQSAAITDLMNRFGGDMSQIDMTGYDPRAIQAGQNQFLDNELTRSQTTKNLRPSGQNPSDKDVLFATLTKEAIAANGGKPLTPQQQAAVAREAYLTKPPVNNISLGSRMKDTAFTALEKKRSEDLDQIIASKPNIEAMDALLNAVDGTGQVIAGGLANLELGAKSLLNATGLTNFEDVAATQAYLGNSVTLVGQIIKQFGSGTGLSDADRDYAAMAAAGKITMDKAALQELVRIAKKVMTLKGNTFNDRVKRSFGSESEEDVWARGALMVDESKFTFGKPSSGSSSTGRAKLISVRPSGQ